MFSRIALLTQRWFFLALVLSLLIPLLANTSKAQEKPAKDGPAKRAGEPWVVHFSPDGRTLAVGRGFPHADGAIMLWDLLGEGRTLLTKGKNRLVAVAFSPDGKKLACGNLQSTLSIFDAASGKLQHHLSGHKESLSCLAWSPNGQTIVTSSLDKTLKLWDAVQGKELKTLAGHAQGVLGVAFSPDGKWVVSSCRDGTLKVWDVATGKEMNTLKGHLFGASCVAISPDGKTIASGSWDSTVRLWDAANGKQQAILAGRAGGVYSLAFSPDGKTLASTWGDYNDPASQGEIRLWNIPSALEKLSLLGHQGGIWCICFSPNGRILATGGADQTVRLWEVATGQPRATLATMAKPVPGKRAKQILLEEDLEKTWKNLAGGDAAQAFQALRQLVHAPTQAVPWLKNQLRPADPALQKQLRQWITWLASEDLGTRENGARQLEKAGQAAIPLLRQTAEESPAAEVRQRAEELIKKLTPADGSSEQARHLRALEALEWIGTPEARQLLETLTRGAPDAWLTLEAKNSLRRFPSR